MSAEPETYLEGLPDNVDPKLKKVLERFGRTVAKQSQQEPRGETAVPASAKIFQFPLPFGDDTRAVSNPLARCALFAAVKERQFFRNYVTVGKINGAEVEFCGEQLNQDDHDTLLQLVKMATHKPFGADVVQAVNAVLNFGRSSAKP